MLTITWSVTISDASQDAHESYRLAEALTETLWSSVVGPMSALAFRLANSDCWCERGLHALTPSARVIDGIARALESWVEAFDDNAESRYESAIDPRMPEWWSA